MVNRGMGTPAYMPPEQARDASTVDARADQYSLGCTLYYLCAGKAPHSGTTAFELITKHMKEPPTPLEVHVRNVPSGFKEIIERMLQKKPEDRYPDMEAVCKDLEHHLGVESDKGPYTPREQHVLALEASLGTFYDAPLAQVRRWAPVGFATLMALLVVRSLMVGEFVLAGGFVGLLVLAPAGNFVLHGLRTKDYLFRRVRSLFFGMPLKSWLKTIVAVGALVAALFVLGWLGIWIGFSLVALGFGAAFQWGVTRRLQAQRQQPLAAIQKVLRELRMRGVSEEALHEFVCRYSGTHWEEFFEGLFGYELMIGARHRWGATDLEGKPRKRFAAWRDPIARWLDGVEQARREMAQRRALAKAEARRLRAEGKSEKDAEAQANREAEHFVSAEKKKRKAKIETMPLVVGEHRAMPVKVFASVRLLAGVGVAGMAAPALLAKFDVYTAPDIVLENLVPYYAFGAGGSLPAAIAGVLLLLSAFSRRLVFPAVIFLGTLLIVTCISLAEMAQQPQLTPAVAAFGGAALALVGFALMLLAKLGGGKF
jgi:hypothetical protein